jgi:hypothetical protein
MREKEDYRGLHGKGAFAENREMILKPFPCYAKHKERP